MKKKLEQEASFLETAEEERKRLKSECDALRQQVEEKDAAYSKLDKTKNRLQLELDDLSVSNGTLRQNVNDMERKQRKFDQVSWQSCFFTFVPCKVDSLLTGLLFCSLPSVDAG